MENPILAVLTNAGKNTYFEAENPYQRVLVNLYTIQRNIKIEWD